jgi:ABC-type Fe3+/spermidine/putrescine transport system ATPase subunit
VVETDQTVAPGTEVTVAVRPEKVCILAHEAGDGHNSLPCKVEQVVYVGNDTRFHVRVSDGLALVVRQQNIIAAPDPLNYQIDQDAPAYAVWRAEAGRLLLD